MTDTELLERIANTLERIATTQDRIETVLAEKQNKTHESKDARELMNNITRYYRENHNTEIKAGTQLHVFKLRDSIAKIKNFNNHRTDNRKLHKWLRLLEEQDFIAKTGDATFLVLDIGNDWWSIEE